MRVLGGLFQENWLVTNLNSIGSSSSRRGYMCTLKLHCVCDEMRIKCELQISQHTYISCNVSCKHSGIRPNVILEIILQIGGKRTSLVSRVVQPKILGAFYA